MTLQIKSVDNKHIEQLFKRLKQQGHHLSNAKNSEVCRVFFVDSDVMSVYINGQVSDIRNGWPSLFSLVEENKPKTNEQIDEESRLLANVTARSVTDFIFGRFRESRNIQSNRLWLTPEHARELDGIIYSILNSMQTGIPDLQNEMIAQFEGLANTSHTEEILVKQRLTAIFKLLIDHSPSGKVARAYDIRRKLTFSPEQAPLFPPLGPSSAFMMRGNSSDFLRRTNKLAQIIFDLLLARLVNEAPQLDWTAAFTIKKFIFNFHTPTRSFNEFLRHLMSTQSITDLIPNNARPDWLQVQCRIACNEVADVFSLARLTTLTENLIDKHSSNDKLTWEVCLFSGSSLLENLLEDLQNKGLANGLFVIHPLTAMRFDKFLRPEEEPQESSNSEQLNDNLVGGRDYALNAIATDQAPIEATDVKRFITSLTELLTTASAAFAPQRDRSLNKIKNTLANSTSFDKNQYLKVVRDVMSREFVRTYMQVNSLAKDPKNRLSMISLPWLALPLFETERSAAEMFVQELHAEQSLTTHPLVNTKTSSNHFNNIFHEDQSGYSAMLCAALGYLAKGKNWLKAAETLANSAVFTALDSETNNISDSYMHEGNEALYLAAFISRMSVVSSRSHRTTAINWRAVHIAQMQTAHQKLEYWKIQKSTVANKSVIDNQHLKIWQLIKLRYKSEEIGRDTFCLLLDTLTPMETLILSAEEINNLCISISHAIEELKHYTNESNANATQSEHELTFVRAQIFVASVQTWACMKILTDQSIFNILPDTIKKLEYDIDVLLTNMQVKQQVASELVDGLRLIFQTHSAPNFKKILHKPTFIKFRKYAEIDEIRVPFFNGLLKLNAGDSFTLALSKI